MSSKAIGIDLGTYNSAASFLSGGEPIMVRSKYGRAAYSKSFPSFVLFDYTGKKQIVGKLAKEQGFLDPKLLVWGVKRLVGLSYETAEKKGEFKRFEYETERGPGGSILIKVGDERYSPSHILEYIIREIKEDAENARINPLIGPGIKEAIVSVPAYFDATRVGPIIEAAKSAGFAQVSTIPEPTAAAIRYGWDLGKRSKILTFDIGAGTLDVTLMLLLDTALDGKLQCGELKTSGDSALGGLDMDDALLNYFIEKYGLVFSEQDLGAKSTFRYEVERAKIQLSTEQSVRLSLPNLRTVDFARSELERVLQPTLEKCRGPIRLALRETGFTADQLDHVLFVGGPTNMPCVRNLVKDELRKLGARDEVLQELDYWARSGSPIDPMDCVAMGASLKAAKVVKHTSTDPYSYGTVLGPVAGHQDYYYSIIPPNSPYPIKQSKGIIHLDNKVLSVPVGLVKKEANDVNGKTTYKYFMLGNFDCYIQTTGEDPEITITLELTKDKVLVTTFTHKQTGESMQLEKLDEFKGKEVFLQETTEPATKTNEKTSASESNSFSGGGSFGGSEFSGSGYSKDPGRNWTNNQMDKALKVGQMVINDYASNCKDVKVVNRTAELRSTIEQSFSARRDTPRIINRITELLNSLKNARVISEDDFWKYKEQLREIEKNA